ncbi:MAG TPA: hypothetical protein VGK64_04015 [Bryobacteraceae bacterium]
MLLRDVPVDAVGIPWEQWMEQQRERIFAEARTKRLAASGPSAFAQSPMLQESTQLSPVSAVQAALPIDDVVRP